MLSVNDHLFGGFETKERDQRADQLLNRLAERYGEPEYGTTRACFFSKNFVLKFPLSLCGERGNDWEGSVRDETLAKGRWLKLDGFICVMQERLTEASWEGKTDDDFPNWVRGIDGGQVGYDRKGNLKAFDFAR